MIERYNEVLKRIYIDGERIDIQVLFRNQGGFYICRNCTEIDENTYRKIQYYSKKGAEVIHRISKETTHTKTVFVDLDADSSEIKEKSAVYVPTRHKGHYHVYFHVIKPIQRGEYKDLARVVMRTPELQGKADIAAVDFRHGRKISENATFGSDTKLCMDVFREYIQKKCTRIKSNPSNLHISEKEGKNILTWTKFKAFSYTDDISVIDFRYAVYALEKGMQPEKVKEILAEESENIEQRHRNVDDYVNRTVEKAMQYLEKKMEVIR